MEASRRSKLGAAFDPRRRIYRDAFNEQFVFLLSAVSAAVVVPLLLLIAGVVFDWELKVAAFVGASVGIELFLIFGLGRPAMKPYERVGWALLWGTAAAIFGVCFYYLVFENAVVT
jgi:hypothetical protein